MKRSCVATLIAGILVTAGCVANQQFRNTYELSEPGCATAVLENNHSYKLGFVEFDEQGWFWDHQQRNKVEEMIRHEAGLDQQDQANRSGLLMVVFAHGWKDNASHDDFALGAFHQILQQLSQIEQEPEPGFAPRKVVGVYLGWRGMSASCEPFREFTFWRRKETAHRVGGYCAMTQMLIELEQIQKECLRGKNPGARRTELVIIGHSFGGAAVYSALSQIVAERYVQAVANKHRLSPPGDQIILLNPAFEASRHHNLDDYAKSLPAYPADQRPVLSIFTSRGDWATHTVFPIGQFFSTLFDADREGQWTQQLHAVGWYDGFVTHDLSYRDGKAVPTTQTSTLNPNTQQHQLPDPAQLKKSMAKTKAQRRRWQPNAAAPKTYEFDDAILQPRSNYRPGNPFPVVAVDPKIMADHDDIKNPVLVNFLSEYIHFCQNDARDTFK